MPNQAATAAQPSFIFSDHQPFQTPSFCGGFAMAMNNVISNEPPSSLSKTKVSTEKEELDKLLADKMNVLSVKDRETMLEEVNGIPHFDPEDPHPFEFLPRRPTIAF